MKWFLRAKHWQIFLIQMAPVLVMPVIVGLFFLMLGGNEPDLSDFSILLVIPVLILGALAFHLSYYWSMANRLQPLLPEGVNHKPKYFNIALAIPLIVAGVGLIMAISFLAQTNFGSSRPATFSFFPVALMILYMLFIMLSIVGGFYQIYFLAKLVKTLELQREARFEEYVLECVLFYFYIVGIWIIQPKINEFAEHLDNPPPPVPQAVN
jgi:hypothetical protein